LNNAGYIEFCSQAVSLRLSENRSFLLYISKN
jgi:hypothetical protein